MQYSAAQTVLQNLFSYDDYRAFLNDYFKAKKQDHPYFSQRYFSKKAGFNAHNFCTMVTAGKRNLSIESVQKIIKAIGLNGAASVFFENLVLMNQAVTPFEKDRYYNRIKNAGRKIAFPKLTEAQYFFYEKWYYPVIRELMVMTDWKEDHALLAKMVRPAIKAREAKEAVDHLLSSGLVIRKDGRYLLNSAFVSSAKVPVYIKKKGRRDVLLKGIEMIDTVAPGDKYVAYSTITMSRHLYEDVRNILDETRAKILSLVADDANPDNVFEVVFQVFPVSDIQKKKAPLKNREERHA